jgi:chorismate synthase
VAVGTFCKAFRAPLGIGILSHVIRIGKAAVPARAPSPGPDDLATIDASPVRSFDPEAGRRMVAEIDRIRRARDTVGGVFEVIAFGLPAGLGSYVQYDRKLDARLAMSLMSIQSVKGVEIGDGFAAASRPGSRAHDEIVLREGRISRASARAGGIEGGMTTGQPVRVRAAMKPFSTVPSGLRTIDLATGAPATAIRQRTDICAVPAGGVVGEAAVAFVLADAVLEKFGGDSLPETARNLRGYVEGLP